AEQMDEAYADSREKNPPSLRGLTFVPHLVRTYPERDLASNILGFVSQEGKGYFGVESQYNELLAGKTRTVWIPSDPNRVTELPEVPDGAGLVLTIDREVQHAMEGVLDRALITSGAESGTIVVLNPKTGEVLAMATTPRLNLNEYYRYGEIFTKDTPFNRAVSQAYEPGSVYKILTMAIAYELGVVNSETVFLDTGAFEYGGAVVINWNGGAWGPQDMQGCMQHSLNVCLAWVSTQIGVKDFYNYMSAFGIGRSSGIDLAGENYGRLKVPGDGDWYDADLVTNSFGQGVSATPLQMASAAAALANDGKLMTPRVVRSLVIDGYQHDFENQVVRQPIRAETARTITELLAHSLENESSDALVTGYRVAGKTGTAEIPSVHGYNSSQTNASFVGWGPADDPQFLVYVWLERPQSSMWGSVVAAPVFREAVEELVIYMNLPPDEIRSQLAQGAAASAVGGGGSQ
ncbi:MAG TPA: penicillin-binding protein 2, partial [Anaerolineales bacterium]|nr:penicillin-binding protein 2 [Anaerolineales bacterium]